MDRAQELGERVSSARREPGLERSSSFFFTSALGAFTCSRLLCGCHSCRLFETCCQCSTVVYFLHFRVAAICYNTRQWYIADSAPPGTPFTMDSYSLGACRRLDAITPVAATVSTCLRGPVCTNTCRHP